jgi:hypothetical protein
MGAVLTSRITYRDPEMTKMNPNPIRLDARGMTTIFFKGQDYQFMAWSRGKCMKGAMKRSRYCLSRHGVN